MRSRISSQRPIERPIAGFVLSLIGGLILTSGSIYGFLAMPFYYGGISAYGVYGVVGLVSGVGVLLGAALAYVMPRSRAAWGILIVVFAVVSIFAFYGFLSALFLAGTPLGLVGGSLTIAWTPEVGLGFEDYRTCLTCGRHVPAEYPICPYCGARAAARTGPETRPPTP